MSGADIREKYHRKEMFSKDSSERGEADSISFNGIESIEQKNVGMKISMARELKVMGLSERSISRVLNVEPCDLEKPSTKER